MRRSVFLAVWLGLVLSLLKESAAETTASTTAASTPTPTESSNQTNTNTTATPTSKPTESSNQTNTNTTATPTSTPTESAAQTTASTTAASTPTSTESSNQTNTNTTATPTSKPTESSNQTNTNTTATPTSTPTESAAQTTASTTVASTPTSTESSNQTNTNTTATPTSKPTESSNQTNTNTTATPTSTPTESSNQTNTNTTATPTSTPTESSNQTNTNTTSTPTSTPTESSNQTNTNTTATPTSKPTESAAQTTASTTVASTPTSTESSNQTNTNTTATPTSKPTESSNQTNTNTTATPTSTPTESSNQTNTNTTATPTSTPTESSNQTNTNTTSTPTSTPTESSTIYETVPVPTMTTPAPAVDFCSGDPCGISLATCISLNSSYTCECQYGFFYSNETCYRGKTFPGTIIVRGVYSDHLQTVNSREYEEVFKNITAFFQEAIGNLVGYMQTVILKIQPTKESRNSVALNVTLTNLFTRDSPENAATVDSAVKRAIDRGNHSSVDSYAVAKPCDVYQCDTKTTECQGDMFPECQCKPDFEKTEWDDRSCSACSKSCSALENKYCVKEEDGPKCKCMANFREKAGKCVACSVGYSGEECTDYSKLILIIVGTVFGAIILSLVIAVSIISVRAKQKQSPEKRSLIKSGYSDMNTSDDRPSMFPRVQTTSGHANPGYQPNNPYEMRSRNRDNFPERDFDDLYEISREPGGFKTQSRY